MPQDWLSRKQNWWDMKIPICSVTTYQPLHIETVEKSSNLSVAILKLEL